jgi:hypothetical protein
MEEKDNGIGSLIGVLLMIVFAIFMFFYTNPKGDVEVTKHYSLGNPSYGRIGYCFELKNISMDDDLAKIKVEIIDKNGNVQSKKEFYSDNNFLPGKTQLFCEEYSDIQFNGKPISYTDNIETYKYKISIKPSSIFSALFGFRKISENNLILGE